MLVGFSFPIFLFGVAIKHEILLILSGWKWLECAQLVELPSGGHKPGHGNPPFVDEFPIQFSI